MNEWTNTAASPATDLPLEQPRTVVLPEPGARSLFLIGLLAVVAWARMSAYSMRETL